MLPDVNGRCRSYQTRSRADLLGFSYLAGYCRMAVERTRDPPLKLPSGLKEQDANQSEKAHPCDEAGRAQTHPRGPGAAGRRLPWGLHLGRSRSPAGRALARDRRHFRHLGWGDERGGHGLRPSNGGARGRARGARGLLARGLGRRPFQPVPARAARRAARPLVAQFLADVCRHGSDVARGVAI